MEKRGKGIVLLHDFHSNTAEALPELLRQLKLASYTVVHLVPKEQLTTVPKYDEMFEHRENLSSNAQPEHVAAPANVAAAHHRGSMYMYYRGAARTCTKKALQRRARTAVISRISL